MAPQRGVTVITTDFPLYTIRMVGDSHFLVAGGGGQAKTGVPNAIEIYELRPYEGSCTAVRVKTHITEGAIMNCFIQATEKQKQKQFLAVFGIDDASHVYTLRSKLVTPKKDGDVSEGLRKRKGNLTSSSSHNDASKTLTFDFDQSGSKTTDFAEGGGFQKAACITNDGSVLVTGGADGHIRAWKFPELKQVYAKKVHTDEIDDLHITPSGDKIVTISRDKCAYVWNIKDGSKHTELHWSSKSDTKYRFRSCRYSSVIDKKDTVCLYTTHIPCIRGKTPAPCFITKWDTSKYLPKIRQKTGTEVLSSFAISENGVYVGVGTIAGSVSVYIAFSLQRLYHLQEAHSIFVTGLEFVPATEGARSLTGDHDLTLLSISADNQVKLHQVASRGEISLIWIVMGFVLCLYVIYWLITTLGL